MASKLLFKTITPLFVVLAMCASKATPKERGTIGDGKVAVLELFTSEGCSSCPAAEEAVANAAKEYGDNILVLAYHVDYWDRLGWKDAFSSASYSQRQRKYAAVMKLDGIYTPQAIVNGQVQFVGSNNAVLHKSIDEALKKEAMNGLQISARSTGANEVTVNYELSKSADNYINIALVQLSAETSVKRGENEGRKLHHVNVVRELKTLDATNEKGSIAIRIPVGLKASDCKVIAFVQNKDALSITAATATSIE